MSDKFFTLSKQKKLEYKKGFFWRGLSADYLTKKVRRWKFSFIPVFKNSKTTLPWVELNSSKFLFQSFVIIYAYDEMISCAD